jgi:hypothetical protein
MSATASASPSRASHVAVTARPPVIFSVCMFASFVEHAET